METIRDITALEELPEAEATSLGFSNWQNKGNFNCQTFSTCGFTCGLTAVN